MVRYIVILFLFPALLAAQPRFTWSQLPAAPGQGYLVNSQDVNGTWEDSLRFYGGLFRITGGLTLTDVTSLSGDSVLVWRGNRVYYRAKSSLLSGYTTGSGTSGYVARWTGTSTLGTGALQDNGTIVTVNDGNTSTAKPFGFDTWTTAGRPTGVTGQAGYNTTTGYSEMYGASAWQQTMLPIGTANYTLTHDGTSWVASSFITNDNTSKVQITHSSSQTNLYQSSGSAQLWLRNNTTSANNLNGIFFITNSGIAAGGLYVRNKNHATGEGEMIFFAGGASGFPASGTMRLLDYGLVIPTNTGTAGTTGAIRYNGTATAAQVYYNSTWNSLHSGVPLILDNPSANTSQFNAGTISLQTRNSTNSANNWTGIWMRGNASGSVSGIQTLIQDHSSGTLTGSMYFSTANAGTLANRLILSADGTLSATNTTSAWRLPQGTTAQRPTGAAAVERFNSDTLFFEGHNGTSWLTFASRNWVRSNFAPIASGYTGWTLAGDTGSETISSGNTATFTGGWGIVTAASATDVLTIRADSSEVATQYDISDRPSGRGEGVATALAYWTDANTLDAFPWYYDAGNVGLGLLSPLYSLDGGNKTDGFRLPNGTTAQRPTANNYVIRGNTSNTKVEIYYASGWKNIATEDWVTSNSTWLKPELGAGNDVDITATSSAQFTIADVGYFEVSSPNGNYISIYDDGFEAQSSDGTTITTWNAYPYGFSTQTFESGVTNASFGINYNQFNVAVGGSQIIVVPDTITFQLASQRNLTIIGSNGDTYLNQYDDTKRDSAAHLIGVQEATGKLVPIAQVNAKYMEDSDLTLTAAEVYKFQEVRVWMSTTAGATSQTELTIPDAAAVYLNTKIVVVSKDASGTYNNLINTATATMYDAGSDASSYPVAAGKTVVLWCVQTGASTHRWAIQQ